MAREKDSIQRLLDKGKTPDEIVASGKYTKEEVDAYLASDHVDDSDNTKDSEVSETSETATNPNEPFTPDNSELEAATETKPEDVEEVIEDKKQNLFGGKTKSETERSYTKGTGKHVMEVQEVFDRPDNSQTMSDDPIGENNSMNGGGVGTTTAAANPKLATASPDQKRIAAEKLYDVVIVPVYKKLCEVLPLTAKFGDRKMRKLVAEDKINLNIPMTWQDENGELVSKPLHELIAEHNRQADEAFKYDEKFVVDAREPSIREFVKRGWGIAEDDELMWILIMKVIDLGQATVILNLKKYDILGEAKTLHAENKAAPKNTRPPVNVPPPFVPPLQPTHHENVHHNPFPDEHEKKSGIEDAEIIEETVRENEEK